ncbi:MAG: AzlD domain-containing protein [Actinomycetales bacterium]|nr:AzlD domain-containing protein [Actinomycetales bacterium]
MIAWLGIVLSGLVTYLLRVAFLVHEKLKPPKAVERYLPLVGPAVLGAIALPGLIAPEGVVSWAQTVPALLASLVSAVVWRFTRQLVLGLVAGLVLWWGLLAGLAALGLG